MEQLPRIIDERDMPIIYSTLYDMSVKGRKQLVPIRALAMLKLMEQTALRAGEVRVLHEDSITRYDDNISLITVPDEQGAKRGSRVVPFVTHYSDGRETPAYKALRRWLSVKKRKSIKSDYLFCGYNGRQVCREDFARYVSAVGKVAGIPYPITPHMWRHTRATELARTEKLQYVQALLGHKSLTMTQRYTHLRPLDVASVLAKHV